MRSAILVASIARSALFNLAFVFSGSVAGERRHKNFKGEFDREAAWTEILKELDCEAARTVSKAARWSGTLVLKF
nr:hypothetical protein [uncultured Campylobacter sp.]